MGSGSPSSKPAATTTRGISPALKIDLYLASASPRRHELLGALGVRFEVLRTDVSEQTEGDPERLVLANARSKAEAGWAGIDPGGQVAVIGADTEVSLDGEVLGKPGDPEQARSYLERLAGREHVVSGGVAVLIGEGGGEAAVRSGAELTRVRFRALDPAEIDAYIASGEWEGKAGGYAIQGLGSMLVDHVHGDLSNVIGLPVALLRGLLPEVFSSRS